MQDLRLAVRALLATPVVTVVAVLSLALGIGANTAIFSIGILVVVGAGARSVPARCAMRIDPAALLRAS